MGEATEVALRVLAEKVGLPGYADMPGALANLSTRERATFCNDHWQEENRRVSPALPRVISGRTHQWPLNASLFVKSTKQAATSRDHMLGAWILATPGLHAQMPDK